MSRNKTEIILCNIATCSKRLKRKRSDEDDEDVQTQIMKERILYLLSKKEKLNEKEKDELENWWFSCYDPEDYADANEDEAPNPLDWTLSALYCPPVYGTSSKIVSEWAEKIDHIINEIMNEDGKGCEMNQMCTSCFKKKMEALWQNSGMSLQASRTLPEFGDAAGLIEHGWKYTDKNLRDHFDIDAVIEERKLVRSIALPISLTEKEQKLVA